MNFSHSRATPRRRLGPRDGPSGRRCRTLVVRLLAAALLTGAGCAGGHAGAPSSERPPERDGPAVETVSGGEPHATDSPGTDEPSAERDEQKRTSSPITCPVETFEVHRFDESTRATRIIDCARREVVEVQQSPLSRTRRRSAEKAGLPRSTWYLLVDPQGARHEFLDADHVSDLSRAYDLRFLDRDASRNLLIYEYTGNL